MDATQAARFDAFYERARDRLAVQLAALTGDPHEAVDHVQEAFVRAWARWDRVGTLDDPEAWVRPVAVNLAVSRFRRSSCTTSSTSRSTRSPSGSAPRSAR